MDRVKIIVLLGLVLCVASQNRRKPYRPLKPGDGCRLANQQRGVCRQLDECQSAVEQLAVSDIWPKVCGYAPDGSTIACCDEGASARPTTPRTTTTAKPQRTTTTTTTETTTTSKAIYLTTTAKASSGERISEKMCRKYSRWQPSLSLRPGEAVEMIKGDCGAKVETFIINGVTAGLLEFPHMAHLGLSHERYGEDVPEWSCGGSLISERYVLTAAHCVRTRDGKKVTHVRLGAAKTQTTIILRVEEVESHHLYKATAHYNDIALLRLERDVTFNNYMRPACLHVERQIGNAAVASGWGTTEHGRSSEDLLKVKLPFVPQKECDKTYANNPLTLPRGIDDDTMVCAGGLNIKNDTCQGDSGGPLQIVLEEPDCMYSIIGITSFGIGCGRAPGVYTRVSAYLPWIESIVWAPTRPAPQRNANLNSAIQLKIDLP